MGRQNAQKVKGKPPRRQAGRHRKGKQNKTVQADKAKASVVTEKKAPSNLTGKNGRKSPLTQLNRRKQSLLKEKGKNHLTPTSKT